LPARKKIVFLHPGKLIRPAPAEFPQDRKVARVGGRSGAISSYPFLLLHSIHPKKVFLSGKQIIYYLYPFIYFGFVKHIFYYEIFY